MSKWVDADWIKDRNSFVPKNELHTVEEFMQILDEAPTADVDLLESLPSAQQWHVIKKRPMTNGERIEWSESLGYDIEYEDAFIYSNLPDDGEDVLVSSQYRNVYVDTFCQDEGCYFEGSGDMDGIVAWMPLPDPYREDGDHENKT